jgi:hypothetical protein
MATTRNAAQLLRWLATLLAVVPTFAAAGTPAPPIDARSPVLCFKEGTPQWYVEQAIARAALARVEFSLSGRPAGEYQFPDSTRATRPRSPGA